MTGGKARPGVMVWAKGTARPPAEPTIRPRRKPEGRRVGATLSIETYVAFKAYVARSGVSGERAIVAAIERLIREG